MPVAQDRFIATMSAFLSRRHRLDCQGKGRPSAVLIPLFWKDNQPQLLLTRRAQTIGHHKGEISFPGGTRDREDSSLQATALRETLEEIGLPAKEVNILGILDDTCTLVSQFVITPFLGCITYPWNFMVNPAETESLLEIPLAFFLNPRNHWHGDFYFKARTHSGHFYPWQGGNMIWGATARIIWEMGKIITEAGPAEL